MLKDDRRYFPPYDAVPLARREMLLAHPEVKEALSRLAGRVSESRRQEGSRQVAGMDLWPRAGERSRAATRWRL